MPTYTEQEHRQLLHFNIRAYLYTEHPDDDNEIILAGAYWNLPLEHRKDAVKQIISEMMEYFTLPLGKIALLTSFLDGIDTEAFHKKVIKKTAE